MLPSILTSFLALAPGSAALGDELVPAETHAVIVGVLEWQRGLTPYPKRNRKDVELRDVLVTRGTPPANIAMLLDENATLPKIREAVASTAKRAGPGSTLIVYYAGHGMPAGDRDYCFANYELDTRDLELTGWRLSELADTLARDFEGERVLLCADCCYSGGLEIVVDRLAAAGIAAADVTSASRANTSTNNWTFTQSLIDALSGVPLVDADDDGRVTLGELAGEVHDAMCHLEGQLHGYKTTGIAGGFVLSESSGPIAESPGAPHPVGSYVRAPDGERRRTGRVVAVDGERRTIQFYDYSDKRTAVVEAAALEASVCDPALPPALLDAGIEPDCEVHWGNRWWRAKVLEKKDGRFLIHYLGYESSWDEWVGEGRIRFTIEKRESGG